MGELTAGNESGAMPLRSGDAAHIPSDEKHGAQSKVLARVPGSYAP